MRDRRVRGTEQRLRRLALVAVILVVASACSGDDATPSTSEAPVTTVQATTTTATPTPTSPPSTITTMAATTTTTETSDAVGDMTETHAEIVAALEIAREIANIPDDAEPYLPDLSNPDPIVALEEAWNFENWMISVNPSLEWVRFYAAPDSPYAKKTEGELLDWARNRWRVEGFADTYYFEDASIVNLTDAEIPADVRSEVPSGAVAILYVQGAGERTVLNRETLEVVDTWDAYGPLTSLTVLAPTAAGWRVFYSDSNYET